MQSVGREQLVSKLSPHSPVFRPANLNPANMEQEEGRPKPTAEEQQRTSATQECTSADWSSPGCSTSMQMAYAQGVACPVTYSQLLPSGLTQQLPAYMWVPVSTQPFVQMSVPPSAAVAVQYSQRSLEDRPHSSVARTRLLAAHLVWRPVRHRQSGSPRVAGSSRAQISQHKQGLLLAPTKLVAKTPEDESASSDPESTGEDQAAANAYAAQRRSFSVEPSYGTGWDSMTEPIMQMIVQRLNPRSQQLCRLVSKRWNYYVTNNLQVINPKRARVHTIREKFRSLTSIDLSTCENVRNRNLAVLAASDLKLTSITVGHAATLAYGKPRITNSALASLAKIPTLRHLSMSDCSAITNNGMQVLSALTTLEKLAFIRCPRISEKGLELVSSLPSLRSLTVFGCTKVTEDLLEVVGNVKQLEALHIGHMRVQGERLGGLALQSSLRELTIHGEELTNGSLSALGSLTQLTALGMTTCYQVSAPLALGMLNDMTGLQRLNLQSFGDLNDAHLTQIASRLPSLQQLKVVLGATVTSVGVEALAGLRSMQAASFECVQASPLALRAVSRLTQLTAVEFPGTTLPPQLLESLGRLPMLEVLNLSNYEPQNMMRTERIILFDDLKALARCLNLKRLDLSNLVLPFCMAADLLARIADRDRTFKPRRSSIQLEELCLCGCPIDRTHMDHLNRIFPLVHCHQNRRRTLPSSTWVWDESAHA